MSQTSEQADNHKADNVCIPSNRWGNECTVDAGSVRERLFEIEKKIAPCKPRIIGVTKYFGLEAIVNGYKAGLSDFGESRALDAINKIKALPEEVRKNVRFHFIGHLQTNKAEKVVEYFDYIHSVDSLKLAEVISKAACRLNNKKRVLLQVNLAKEEQKFGYSREQLVKDMPKILSLEFLEVEGLMCMAPFGASDVELRKLFAEVREFREELQEDFGVYLPELSMGMSDDYHIAALEGATMIRIGRKLFK